MAASISAGGTEDEALRKYTEQVSKALCDVQVLRATREHERKPPLPAAEKQEKKLEQVESNFFRRRSDAMARERPPPYESPSFVPGKGNNG